MFKLDKIDKKYIILFLYLVYNIYNTLKQFYISRYLIFWNIFSYITNILIYTILNNKIINNKHNILLYYLNFIFLVFVFI